MNFKTCKRIFVSLLMALVMLSTCVCAASTDTTASIMRFEKGIGFYSIANALGHELTVRDGGRIYSGYEVKTGLGYAWISLDDDKVIKLAWNTQVTITKDGNKLEVLVDSGEIFFDVSQALDEDESLAIRTSTMYSGIRGTSGTVSVRAEELMDDSGNSYTEKISTLTVYDGTVAATTVSQESSTPQTEMVSASQQATAKETPSETGSSTTIEVSDMPVADALTESPFAAVEVAENPDLQERIEQANQTNDGETTSLSPVLDNAQDTLTAKEESDTTQAKTTTQTVDDAQDEVTSSAGSSTVEEAFTSSSSSDDDSSSSSSSGSSGGSTDTDTNTDTDTGGTTTPTATYTVTYQYEGYTFATLSVTSGNYAYDTVIIPTAQGYWSTSVGGTEFAFATVITDNTTLYWVDTTAVRG